MASFTGLAYWGGGWPPHKFYFDFFRLEMVAYILVYFFLFLCVYLCLCVCTSCTISIINKITDAK